MLIDFPKTVPENRFWYACYNVGIFEGFSSPNLLASFCDLVVHHSFGIPGAKFGNHELTRCIGNYFVKGGYKEFDILSSAASEPVIPEPHIRSIPIDESCR